MKVLTVIIVVLNCVLAFSQNLENVFIKITDDIKRERVLWIVDEQLSTKELLDLLPCYQDSSSFLIVQDNKMTADWADLMNLNRSMFIKYSCLESMSEYNSCMDDDLYENRKTPGYLNYDYSWLSRPMRLKYNIDCYAIVEKRVSSNLMTFFYIHIYNENRRLWFWRIDCSKSVIRN